MPVPPRETMGGFLSNEMNTLKSAIVDYEDMQMSRGYLTDEESEDIEVQLLCMKTYEKILEKRIRKNNKNEK